MFRPQIQKTKTLFFIACLSMVSVYLVSQSNTYIKKDGIDDKIRATKIMQSYIDSIKKSNLVSINDEDLYQTGLIGVESSNITTVYNEGSKNFLNSKISCTHPNFSALAKASSVVPILEHLSLNFSKSGFSIKFLQIS